MSTTHHRPLPDYTSPEYAAEVERRKGKPCNGDHLWYNTFDPDTFEPTAYCLICRQESSG